MINMNKLILTSQGLNTKTGFQLIQHVICKEDHSNQRILIITRHKYHISESLIVACEKLGFIRDNIVLFDGETHTNVEGFFDYIYVSEGNVFEMLYDIQRFQLIPYVRQLVEDQGTIYIGSSAGAALAGTDVKMVGMDFDVTPWELTDYRGFGLFSGTIVPHYHSLEEFQRYLKNTTEEEQDHYVNIYGVLQDGIIVMNRAEFIDENLSLKYGRYHVMKIPGWIRALNSKKDISGDCFGSKFYQALHRIYEGSFVFAEGVTYPMILEDYGYISEETYEQIGLLFEKATEMCQCDNRDRERMDQLITTIYECLVHDAKLSPILGNEVTCMEELIKWMDDNVKLDRWW